MPIEEGVLEAEVEAALAEAASAEAVAKAARAKAVAAKAKVAGQKANKRAKSDNCGPMADHGEYNQTIQNRILLKVCYDNSAQKAIHIRILLVA